MSHLFGALQGITISTIEQLVEPMEKVISTLGLHEVTRAFYQFEPQGATGVIVLSESHFSAHTYPEDQRIYLDLFCCSKDFKPDKAADVIGDTFGASSFDWSYIKRF